MNIAYIGSNWVVTATAPIRSRTSACPGDRNTRYETADLDVEFARLIEPLLRDWPLIVVGYRGAEASIMDALLGRVASGRTAFRNGLYWCSRGDAN